MKIFNTILGTLFVGSFILCFFEETLGSVPTFNVTIFLGLFWIGRTLVDGFSKK